MVVGQITAAREIVFRLAVFDRHEEAHEFRVILDTGFDGYLTLPPTVADALGLPEIEQRRIFVGGDQEELVAVYKAAIEWDGQRRDITVYGLETQPVIGMALIYGYDVHFHAIDGGVATLIALQAPSRPAVQKKLCRLRQRKKHEEALAERRGLLPCYGFTTTVAVLLTERMASVSVQRTWYVPDAAGAVYLAPAMMG